MVRHTCFLALGWKLEEFKVTLSSIVSSRSVCLQNKKKKKKRKFKRDSSVQLGYQVLNQKSGIAILKEEKLRTSCRDRISFFVVVGGAGLGWVESYYGAEVWPQIHDPSSSASWVLETGACYQQVTQTEVELLYIARKWLFIHIHHKICNKSWRWITLFSQLSNTL